MPDFQTPADPLNTSKLEPKLDKIAAALAKAQEDIGTVPKTKKAVYGMYADHAHCWDAVRGPLTKNGIAFTQLTKPNDKGVLLITRLIHSSGQYLESELFMPAKDPHNPQTYGAALTYARRYALCAITGLVADEDDDGNTAAGRFANRGQNAKSPMQQLKAQVKTDSVSQLAHPITLKGFHTLCTNRGWHREDVASYIHGPWGTESSKDWTDEQLNRAFEIVKSNTPDQMEEKMFGGELNHNMPDLDPLTFSNRT